MGISTSCDAKWIAADAGIKADIDLVVVEVRSGGKCLRGDPEPVEMKILRVGAFLQPRVMLLESIAIYRVVEVEREIRIQVES
jgi:hypothetical protein